MGSVAVRPPPLDDQARGGVSSRVKPTHIPADAVSRQRAFNLHHRVSRTTKTGVRDFCDMSTPLAGPDRSQQATTERRIGRKPR